MNDARVCPVVQRSAAEIDARAMKDRLILDGFAQILPNACAGWAACSFLAEHGARILLLARAAHTDAIPPP